MSHAPYRKRTPASLKLWVVGTLMIVSFSGCVRRRMTVRTSPPGAMVYVDHQSIGTTPVSANFTYYGTRQFEIIKDGYRTEKFLRKFNPPWYQWPVFDFIAESIWPFEKRDERILDVQLTPEVEVPTQALIKSGEELRTQAARGLAVSTAGARSQLVVPSGTVPFSAQPGTPLNPTIPPAGSLTIPGFAPPAGNATGPSIFDVPPVSYPATQVAPGSSYRQDLGKPSVSTSNVN
jgi:PEGA domain